MERLIDNAPCCYLIFNDQGYLVDVNNTLCVTLGISREQLLMRKFESLLNIAGRIFFQTHFFPLLKLHQNADEIFLSLLTHDGAQVPVVINARRDETQEATQNICVCLPVYNRRKYEDEILDAKKVAEAALEQNKELATARAEAIKQAAALDRQVNQLSRLNDELYQFNNIIHHDMQECIRKILMFCSLVKTEPDIDYLAKINNTAHRLKLINTGLQFFINLGLELPDFKELELTHVLMQAKADILAETGFDGLTLTHDQLPVIEGSWKQLQQLFYHLLSNCIRYRKGDAVDVSVTSAIYEHNIFKHNPDRYAYTEVVRINVSDNGSGFDNAYKEYVFEVLKKLYKDSVGVGIGLSICRKVADNHHGQISISSAEGAGTTVSVILPLKQMRVATG